MKNQKQISFANEAPGTHEGGNITVVAATDIQQRYLFGTLFNGEARPAQESDRALCVITDSPNAGDLTNVQILGSNAGTMKVLAGSIIEAGDEILSDKQGQAISLLTAKAGTHNICGIAIANALPGEYVEFTPTLGATSTK